MFILGSLTEQDLKSFPVVGVSYKMNRDLLNLKGLDYHNQKDMDDWKCPVKSKEVSNGEVYFNWVDYTGQKDGCVCNSWESEDLEEISGRNLNVQLISQRNAHNALEPVKWWNPYRHPQTIMLTRSRSLQYHGWQICFPPLSCGAWLPLRLRRRKAAWHSAANMPKYLKRRMVKSPAGT